jgi:hypothetical protein
VDSVKQDVRSKMIVADYTGERFYTVLGTPEVDSAEKAVRSIADQRKGDA